MTGSQEHQTQTDRAAIEVHIGGYKYTLTKDGWIESIPGVGTFVSSRSSVSGCEITARHKGSPSERLPDGGYRLDPRYFGGDPTDPEAHHE